MWLWVLKLLPGVGGFLRKYWKFIAVAVLLAAVFFAGAKWQDAKHQKVLADIAQQTTLAISAREATIRAEHAIQSQADTESRRRLQSDLTTLRRREKVLQDAVRVAQLVKPTNELVCEGLEEVEGETFIIANPFSVQFTELWNDASRRDPAQ